MNALKFAVIGKDVSRSSSPAMHRFIAAGMGKHITYDNISVPPEEFSRRAEEFFGSYDGFNITIPFKLEIIPFLSELEGDAHTFGAVNTVISSTRRGYNTDGQGYALMLKNSGVQIAGAKVLLLGAGGAGRSAAKKMKDGGADVYVYDRNMQSSENVAAEFGVTCLKEVENIPYDVIVNATGVGMHKTEGISPVGRELIELCDTAVDLIYVPPKSAFLQLAEGLGKRIVNGMSMLFYQAYYAECIYHGRQPDDGEAAALYKKFTEA